MTTIAVIEPVSDSERDNRRSKFEGRKAEARRARAALKGAEAALRVCDEHINMRRAAIVTNQQELQARKAERAGLVEDRKRYRKESARTAAKAEKAEARYDRAVLGRVVEEAKDAEQAAASATVSRTATATTPKKSSPPRRPRPATKRTARRTATTTASVAAKKATRVKQTAKRTGRAGASSPRPRSSGSTPAKASPRRG
jgi:hypothetical protein